MVFLEECTIERAGDCRSALGLRMNIGVWRMRFV